MVIYYETCVDSRQLEVYQNLHEHVLGAVEAH
jgi:hypothetical protein